MFNRLSKIQSFPKYRLLFYWSLVLLLSILISFNAYKSIDTITVSGEADHYLAEAYNLYKYRTISLDKNDKENPPVTAAHEPVFPSFLALSLAFNPSINKNVSLNELRKDGNPIKQLKYSQIPILMGISLCSMYVVITITKNMYLGFLALIMTGFSPSLIRSLITMHTEAFAALLALCVSIFLYKIFVQQKIRHFIFLGFTLGGVVLVRAQFIYLIAFVICLLFYGLYKKVFKNKKMFYVGLITFITIYSLIVGGWIGRNYVHLKLPKVCERGSYVLLIRAEKDLMNIKEYFGSFIYYPWNGGFFHFSTPDKYSKKQGVIDWINIKRSEFSDFFNLGELVKEGGVLGRLNRQNNSSFIKTAEKEHLQIIQKYAESPNSLLLIEIETERLAIDKILAHPIRHVLAAFPFAWRGSFFEVPVRSKHAPFELIGVLLMIISLLYFPALFFITFVSFRKKNWPLLAFSLPALYLFSIQSLFTHYMPRYSYSIVPILVASFLISIRMVTEKKQKQKP